MFSVHLPFSLSLPLTIFFPPSLPLLLLLPPSLPYHLPLPPSLPLHLPLKKLRSWSGEKRTVHLRRCRQNKLTPKYGTGIGGCEGITDGCHGLWPPTTDSSMVASYLHTPACQCIPVAIGGGRCSAIHGGRRTNAKALPPSIFHQLTVRVFQHLPPLVGLGLRLSEHEVCTRGCHDGHCVL